MIHLFRRSIHPELFQTVQQRRLRWAGGFLDLSLTTAGHVLEFRRGANAAH